MFAIGDHVGKHLFAVLIDTNKESIHVFDSLSQRTDADIKRLRLSKKGQLSSFTIHNHTTRPYSLQRGSSCGPWTTWFILAFVTNANDCRGDGGQRIRERMLTTDEDVRGFWKLLSRTSEEEGEEDHGFMV